ncbi:TPA: hypothetical protein ACH3X3_006820 [Trebouxia sp. C0006]
MRSQRYRKYGSYGGKVAAIRMALSLDDIRDAQIEVEAYTRLNQLQGKHVPQLLGYGRSGQGFCVATSYIQAEPFDWHSRTHRALDGQLLAVIDSIHSFGICHRDLHSGNILNAHGYAIESQSQLPCKGCSRPDGLTGMETKIWPASMDSHVRLCVVWRSHRIFTAAFVCAELDAYADGQSITKDGLLSLGDKEVVVSALTALHAAPSYDHGSRIAAGADLGLSPPCLHKSFLRLFAREICQGSSVSVLSSCWQISFGLTVSSLILCQACHS